MSKRNEGRQGYKETTLGWIPEDWGYVRAREISVLGAGGTPSTSVDEYWGGDILWMRSGDLNLKRIYNVKGRITKKGLDNSSAFLIPRHSVLIGLAGQGKTRGTVAINEIELAANQSVVAFMPYKDKVYYLYLFYNLERRYYELRRLSTGDGGRGGLNLHLLGNLRLTVPPVHEQLKIAEILIAWDKAIELVGKQIEAKQRLKKGLMQQMLTGRMRFQGFGKQANSGEIPEEWNIFKLGDAFNRISRPVPENIKNVLSITARVGFVTQQEKFSKIIAGKTLSKYTLLRKKEFAYNKGNSKPYPQGCIYRLEEFEQGAVPKVYFCFRPCKQFIYSLFYKYYFQNGMLNSQLRKYINSGVRNDGLLNIYSDDFFSVRVFVPPFKEQIKIAQFIDSISKEIEMLIEKEEMLKEQKQGLMQKLLTGEVRV